MGDRRTPPATPARGDFCPGHARAAPLMTPTTPPQPLAATGISRGRKAVGQSARRASFEPLNDRGWKGRNLEDLSFGGGSPCLS